MKTDAQVFRAAADRVRRGWTQGCMRDDQGRSCALDALIEACGPSTLEADEQFTRCACLLMATLGLQEKYPMPAIIRWNDFVFQTQERVAEGFDLAAAVCEQLPEPEEALA